MTRSGPRWETAPGAENASSAVFQPPALPPPDPVLPVAEPARPAQPAPQVQDPPRVQMPVAPVQARQGSTQAAEPKPQHRRPPRPANNQVRQVNRSVAGGFNRRAEPAGNAKPGGGRQNTAVRAVARAWPLSSTGSEKSYVATPRG